MTSTQQTNTNITNIKNTSMKTPAGSEMQ